MRDPNRAGRPGTSLRVSVISLVLPTLHVGLCLATKAGRLAFEGSWGWFLVFVVDFPLSILLLPFLKIADPLLVFGILGTAWWYLISRLGVYCAGRLSEFRQRRLASHAT